MCLHNLSQVRSSFWKNATEEILAGLLELAAYPEEQIIAYRAFYSSCISPQLGPSPAELGPRSLSSYMGDDSTPIEFSWAVGADGTQTVRFTMEPLSPLDGTPTLESTWIASLRSLGHSAACEGFDLTWSKVCHQALVQRGSEDIRNLKHGSQFSVGCDFTRSGTIIGKSYFLPHIRSKSTGIPTSTLVAECMRTLGLETPWEAVYDFIDKLPDYLEATPEIVSVDCLEPSKNRVKVYLRTNATSLENIRKIMTLGYTLTDPVVSDTIQILRRLWQLLFPNTTDTMSLRSRNSDHYASGFVVYFEMSLGNALPLPKVYIPVRHYCENDHVSAEAMAAYFADSVKEFAAIENIRGLFTHRALTSRTGVYTYVGCAARKAGPQVSLYLSPEVFAPERNIV